FQLRGLLFPRIDQAGLGFELLRASADFRLRAVDRLSRLTEFPTLCTEALFRGPEVLLDSTEFRFALVDSFLGVLDYRTSFVECLERSLSADDLLLRSQEIPCVLSLGLRGRFDFFLVGPELIRGLVHRLLSSVQFASPLYEPGLGRLQGGFSRGDVFRSGIQDGLATLQVSFGSSQLGLLRAELRFR